MYVVTGLTRMNTGVCMSVYDTKAKRYLRPIPPSSRFSLEDVGHLQLFSIVQFHAKATSRQIRRPHTEDFEIVEQRPIVKGILPQPDRIDFLRQISVNSVNQIFGFENGRPVLKRHGARFYVSPDTGSNSLGTVVARQAKVYRSYEKIRVSFTDNSGQTFDDVPLVCIDRIDIERLNRELQCASNTFVRLSLARPFAPTGWGFEACSLQVSCIHAV